jgi:hypothetical protein
MFLTDGFLEGPRWRAVLRGGFTGADGSEICYDQTTGFMINYISVILVDRRRDPSRQRLVP